MLSEIAKKVGAKGNTIDAIAKAVTSGGGTWDPAVFATTPGQTIGQERTAFYNKLVANPKDKNVQAIVSGLDSCRR